MASPDALALGLPLASFRCELGTRIGPRPARLVNAGRGARRRRLRCSAAASLRISTGTARNHLKNIFRKSGVRRQSDLVRLLLTASMAWETRR
jgi:hypothetical protein